MLVKVYFEFHLGSILDLIRQSVIAMAIAVSLQNAHSIVTLVIGD